jgi:uncharacterized protein (TIGR02246 family)
MQSDVTKELIELEKQYWQAIKDNDADTAAMLTDDPCVVAGAQGVSSVSKKQLIKMMEKPNYTLDEFSLTNPTVRLLGDDVAVVAYKVREELTVEGKPLTLEASEASAWVKRGGRWLCALHTESIAGDPFGRDRSEQDDDDDDEEEEED